MNENELARRRRVKELTQALAGSFLSAKHIMDSFVEFEIGPIEGIRMGLDELADPIIRKAFETFLDGAGQPLSGMPSGMPVAMPPRAPHPMDAQLDRLFDAAPKLPPRPGEAPQAPAMECMVTMPSGNGVLGVLSRTPDGMLRMLATATENGQTLMVEHFFEVHEISMISVRRDVKAVPASPLIWPVS